MNQSKQITIIGLAIIASVIAAPFVYAAVEPHIILVMDAGQTTNPFTIQNNTNYDILTIDTKGGINNVINIAVSTSEANVYSVGTSNDLTDPIIVASWNFDKSNLEVSAYRMFGTDLSTAASGKRDSGSGNCFSGWYELTSGTWSNGKGTVGLTSAGYTMDYGITGSVTALQGIGTSLAYILYNSDGATECSYKSLIGTGALIVPQDMIVTRGV
jgi:hypothetical protein